MQTEGTKIGKRWGLRGKIEEGKSEALFGTSAWRSGGSSSAGF